MFGCITHNGPGFAKVGRVRSQSLLDLPVSLCGIPFVRARTNYKRWVELPKPNGRLHVAQLLQSRCYAAEMLNLGIEAKADLSAWFSSSMSKSSCNPSQNLAELPKYLENRKAVSAVTLRLPLMIAEILGWGIPVSLESLYAEMPSGRRNSSSKISPGWIFLSRFIC